MIEVRIRTDAESEAHHLTDVPFTALDEVIPTLSRWGCANSDEFYGQFVIPDTGNAYFEVVATS